MARQLLLSLRLICSIADRKKTDMNLLRSSANSLALLLLFTSFGVCADDCRDAQIAESCACQSDVQTKGKQPRTAKKGASANPVNARTSGGMKVVERPKTAPAPTSASNK